MTEREEQRQAKLLQERIATSLAAGQAAVQSAQIGEQLPRTVKVQRLCTTIEIKPFLLIQLLEAAVKIVKGSSPA